MKMEGKTVLVTGATDGIGKQTALELAQRGASVLLHGRNADKGRKALEEIRERTDNKKLYFLCYDFASLKDVRAMAEDVRKRFEKLDVLINNAGVYMKNPALSEEGLEMTFAVNHLAHFLLSNLLKNLLLKSASSRVITVSSVTHQGGRLDFGNLRAEKDFDGYQAYADSKLANVLFAYAFARRLEGAGVTSNALHPGVIGTKLLRAGFGPGGASVERGARTPVYLACSSEVEKVSGAYFEDGKQTRSAPDTYDIELQDRLWQVSKDLCRPVELPA